MNVIESVFGVFTKIGEWVRGELTGFTEIFYVPESGLTFLGVLALCGLGIGVVFLLINTIRGFLQFRH